MGTYATTIGTDDARDTLTEDVSSDLSQPAGTSQIRTSRGYDKASVGASPRAGSASFRLNNTGLPYGLLDPRPGIGIKLDKTESAATTALWTGNIDNFVQRPTMFKPVVEVQCLGVFARLAGQKVSSVVYENITTGVAIGHVLDLVGIPASLQDLDVGEIPLRWWWCDEDDALDMIQRLRMTEGITADLFEAGSGAVTFRDRSSRFVRAAATTSQSTFTSEGAEPQLSDPFEWQPLWREIVNEATHDREVYLEGSSEVVWTDDTGLYLIQPNDTLILDARHNDGFIFKDAIVPVENTDFTVGVGGIASVTLDRTSGAWVRITFTAGALGASILVTQMRGTPIDLIRTVTEKNAHDASTSITAYDLRPWQGKMWPVIGWAEMRDNLDAIVIWKKDPAASVKFGVLANRGTAADAATRVREIGERITIVETDLDINFEAYIERIEHSVSPVNWHETIYECSVNFVATIPTATTHGPTLLSGIETNDIWEQFSSNRRQVWVDENIVYVFGRADSSSPGLGYWKSTDAGATWSAVTVIAVGGSTEVVYDIYYERWNGPTKPNIVHIVRYSDAGTRGCFYMTFNLDTDLASNDQEIGAGSTSPYMANIGVTVALSGRIYVQCGPIVGTVGLWYSDDLGVSWTDTTETIESHEDVTPIMWPLFGGDDDDDIRALMLNTGLGHIKFLDYDADVGITAASAEILSGITLDSPGIGAFREGSPWSSCWDPDTGMIYIACLEEDDIGTGPKDLLCATVAADGTITARTNILSAITYCNSVGLSFIGGSIYAFYTRDPDDVSSTDMDGFYKISTDNMATWGSEISYPADDAVRNEQLIIDPNPRSVLMPGLHRGTTDDVYFGDTIPVGTVEGVWADHNTNPFTDLDAQDQEQDGVDHTEQGLLLRGVEG